MRPFFPALVFAFAATAANASPYDEAGVTWVAYELVGAPVEVRTTIVFAKPGQFGGQAPCNVYGADQTADWPAFHAENIFSTKMACEALGLEIMFFDALSKATQAELTDQGLVLSDETGALIRLKAE